MIKLFEDFKVDDLYWEISCAEYNLLVSRKELIPFTDVQVDELRKIGVVQDNIFIPQLISINRSRTIMNLRGVKTCLRFTDEYYIVNKDNNKFYKCDQWDGFKTCIENLLNL